MIGRAEAVRRIVTVNAPILCVDTCSLLDLARDPTRPIFDSRHAQAALDLIARVEAKPATLTIILTEQVINELNVRLSDVISESERVIERLNQALDICTTYGVYLHQSSPPVIVSAFIMAVSTIIQRFHQSALQTKHSAASLRRARERVVDGRAPAKTGKQSWKDCEIIENYLELIGAARLADFAGKSIFLTSNTNDYAAIPSAKLHADLVADFQRVQLDFAVNILEVKYSI